jgi:hypothetical protein
MRLDIPIKIMYGCIAGRFVQKVFTLLAGKRGSLHGDNLIVGMFAVYTDTTSIAQDQYLLIGNVEYGKIIYRTPTSIFELLREPSNMQVQRWEFDHIDVLSLENYPESYGSITSTGASSRFMDQRTQYAVIKAFKEFVACK